MATKTDRNDSVFTMMVREYKKAEEGGKDRPTAAELRQKAEKIDPEIKNMDPRSFTGTYILSASRAAKKGTEEAPKTRKSRKSNKTEAPAATNGNGHGTAEENFLVNVLSEFAEAMYQTFGGTNRIAFYQFLGENLPALVDTTRKAVEAPETANA